MYTPTEDLHLFIALALISLSGFVTLHWYSADRKAAQRFSASAQYRFIVLRDSFSRASSLLQAWCASTAERSRATPSAGSEELDGADVDLRWETLDVHGACGASPGLWSHGPRIQEEALVDADDEVLRRAEEDVRMRHVERARARAELLSQSLSSGGCGGSPRGVCVEALVEWASRLELAVVREHLVQVQGEEVVVKTVPYEDASECWKEVERRLVATHAFVPLEQ